MDPWTPWNSPGQNTGVGSLFLLQGIFPAQGLKPVLPHCRQILYQLSHKESHLCMHVFKTQPFSMHQVIVWLQKEKKLAITNSWIVLNSNFLKKIISTLIGKKMLWPPSIISHSIIIRVSYERWKKRGKEEIEKGKELAVSSADPKAGRRSWFIINSDSSIPFSSKFQPFGALPWGLREKPVISCPWGCSWQSVWH